MGRRGPAPKPTVLKKLAGNPGRRALNDQEAKPDTTMPRCPHHLNAVAQKEWRRVARRLHKAGLLTYVDMAALAVYCQAYGRWVEAEVMLAGSGSELVVETPNGYPMQNPLISIVNTTTKQMLDALAEFGMTPASRSRIKVDPPNKDKDELDALFSRVGKRVKVSNE
ncbi:MAG: phage terminase small subunit P27 family [Anaerolineaceae bacterium]|nr:phage terminase small subunit P27 family [Anaerolineaceae bacterium]